VKLRPPKLVVPALGSAEPEGAVSARDSAEPDHRARGPMPPGPLLGSSDPKYRHRPAARRRLRRLRCWPRPCLLGTVAESPARRHSKNSGANLGRRPRKACRQRRIASRRPSRPEACGPGRGGGPQPAQALPVQSAPGAARPALASGPPTGQAGPASPGPSQAPSRCSSPHALLWIRCDSPHRVAMREGQEPWPCRDQKPWQTRAQVTTSQQATHQSCHRAVNGRWGRSQRFRRGRLRPVSPVRIRTTVAGGSTIP
jgi:hypothetical protein